MRTTCRGSFHKMIVLKVSSPQFRIFSGNLIFVRLVRRYRRHLSAQLRSEHDKSQRIRVRRPRRDRSEYRRHKHFALADRIGQHHLAKWLLGQQINELIEPQVISTAGHTHVQHRAPNLLGAANGRNDEVDQLLDALRRLLPSHGSAEAAAEQCRRTGDLSHNSHVCHPPDSHRGSLRHRRSGRFDVHLVLSANDSRIYSGHSSSWARQPSSNLCVANGIVRFNDHRNVVQGARRHRSGKYHFSQRPCSVHCLIRFGRFTVILFSLWYAS